MNELEILMEDTVGKFSSYIIEVRTNDPGSLPHFHVLDANSRGKKFHTCVSLMYNKYFLHEGKMDVFTSIKDRKKLNEFLHKKCKYGNFTNWKYCVMLWNESKRNQKVPDVWDIPDYTNITMRR